MERVLSFDEALREVLQHAASLPRNTATDVVRLLEAAGRTLAVEVRAERDQPPFARSTRDGFAIRSEDLATERGLRERGLRIVGSVRAGETWTGPDVHVGEALEIMTGAPLPAGTDAVLMIEHAVRTGDTLHPKADRRLQSGENVVAQGAEARAFAAVLPAGRRVGPAEVALAAACGYARLMVAGKPRVAIVATGDELVELTDSLSGPSQDTLRPSQIRNSNSYALAALVSEEGGAPVRLPIACDTREDLRERIQAGREHDLILFSGGVSMGRYDLVEPVLAEAGAEFLFTGALIQPGKPVVFGRLPRGANQSESRWTYFFGLPGNPVSTEVCFRLFVAPMLRALAGRTEHTLRFVEAHLSEDVRGGAKVTRLLPALVTSNWKRVQVKPVPWQGSGDLAANARANGFVVLPAGEPSFAAGQAVRVLLR